MAISTRINLVRLLPALLLVAAMLLPATAGARPMETGVVLADGPTNSDPLTQSRVKGAGSRYSKLTVFWNEVAPDPESPLKPPLFNASDPGAPEYNFGHVDIAVQRIRAAGLEPVLTVVNAPRWARQACSDNPACSPIPSEYGAFATAIVSRYSGGFDPGGGFLPRVRYWQAWVEPNLTLFYQPIFHGGQPVSPGNYREILAAFYNAAKGVNASNQVMAAGLAPLARPGASIGPLNFLRRLLCMAGRRKPRPAAGCTGSAKFDIAAIHPYTTGGPTHHAPGPDDVSLGDMPEVTKLIRAADRAGKIQNASARTPIWATEFSWDSKPPDSGGLPPRLHSLWTAEAIYRAWKAGLSAFFWFALRDDAPNGRPDAEVFQAGLYTRGATLAQDRPKRVLRAFRFPFVAFRSKKGFTFWGRTPTSRRMQVRVQLKNGRGGFKTVKRVRASGQGIFQGTVRRRGVRRSGQVRAKTPKGTSLPFAFRFKRDCYQPPFGGPKSQCS
jgi:hypothetical protein